MNVFLFLISSRLFLSNKVVTNLTLNSKLSKKIEGSWYYVKCQKKRNCSNVIFEIRKHYNITDVSFITNNAFSIYLTKENSKVLNLMNLKYSKIPKDDKIVQTQLNSKEMSNNYIVYLSKSCKIPYNTIDITSNYIIFQSEEAYPMISKKLSKIGCIRSFEQLPKPRLNSQSGSNKKDKPKKDDTIDSNEAQAENITKKSMTTVRSDTFLTYNHFQDENNDEDDSDNSNNGYVQKLPEGTIFSLHSSSTYRNLLKHGINGEGQVASIVDTGLDSNLCWFVDPERQIEYGKESPSDHRKIQGYFSYADENDITPGGHGSFVAGLIAGSAQCDLYVNEKCSGSYFDGLAPNAKLVINDVFYMKKSANNKKVLDISEDVPNQISSDNQINSSGQISSENKNSTSDTNAKVLEDNDQSKTENTNDTDNKKSAVDSIDEKDRKEDAIYKKKMRDERKMRSKLKRRQKIENPVQIDNENDNEIIYYNPYDESDKDQVFASFPQNLSRLFVLPSKLLGATVQYHGFDFQDKSLFTSLIDTFSYENPRMLLVFPAGDRIYQPDKMIKNGKPKPKLNDYLNAAAVTGMKNVVEFSYDRKTMLTTSKVASPGDSKNVLTVGATVIDSKVSVNEFEVPTPIIIINKGVEYVGYCDEFFGISFFDYLVSTIQFSSDKTDDSFDPVSFNQTYSFVIGNQVFVDSIKLDAFTFIQSPKFETTDILLLFHGNDLNGKINKPIIRLPEEHQKKFSNGDTIQIKFFNDIESFHLKKFANNEAKYSRKNPRYFRKKPDIYLPGGPVYGPNSGASKKSPNYCGIGGVRTAEGTSIAAAFATGEILLIQQYIKNGYYLNKKEGIEITSHMMRAILSNIAIDSSNNFTSPNLNKFCIFKDDYKLNETGGIRFFSDSLTSHSHHTYKFKAQFDGPLKITVCWNDPPHDPFAPSDVLFKVDCRIESVKDGRMFGDVHFDPFNTVKSYVIQDVKKDEEYSIYVICEDNFFFEKVNYTIVISGLFDHFSSENEYVKKIDNNKKQVKCLQICKEKSKCVGGYCQCAKNKYGEDCSKEMIQMHNHKTVSDISLLPRESVFMSYVFKQWKPGSKLSFTFSIKRPNSNSKNKKNDLNETVEINDDITNRIFFMFSINHVPSWQSANCNSENCQWATIKKNALEIEYHLWNFVRNGDTLYLVAYSLDDLPLSFSVRSLELYT